MGGGSAFWLMADEPVFVYDARMVGGGPGVFALPSIAAAERSRFPGGWSGGFSAGLLPEADPRDRIASILGISAGNDFAMLERIGGECAGAVSLLPEEMPPAPSMSQESCVGWRRRARGHHRKISRNSR